MFFCHQIADLTNVLLQFPGVVEGIFNAIDAISREATAILNRPEGEQLENGSVTSSSGGVVCTEDEHHSLQVGSPPSLFIAIRNQMQLS